MEEFRIRDIMTPDPVTVSPDTPVTEVARLMIDMSIGGVPVVDNEGDLLGIVTESDLIVQEADVRFPSFVHFLDAYIFVPGALHRFEEKFRKSMAATAGDLMTIDVETVEADLLVSEVAGSMMKKRLKRFPVMEEGRLVGIVTMADIVRLLGQEGQTG